MYLTAAAYNNLVSKDPATLYFIDSETERRIAIGDTMFANYVEAHCTAVSLNVSNISIGVGETYTIVATTEPASPSDTIVWESSTPDVTISSTTSSNRIIVTGAAIGVAVITCTCGEMSAFCSVDVHRAYVYTEHILAENYSPDGSKFIYTAPISLTDGQYIELSIDVSTVTGNKENIISIGHNISTWNGANTGSRTHMYLTASSRTKLSVDLILDNKTLRPTYTIDGTTLLIRLDSSGVWLNGSHFLYDTDMRATPTLTYDEGMAALLALTSYDIGSQEGSNRSHATYNYIKYFTTE